MRSDRMLYQSVHLKLHSRIAQNARCPALLEAIEKTHALASIWYCVSAAAEPDRPDHPARELADALCDGAPHQVADAVREHLAVGMARSLEVLQPYFKLRKLTGTTFYRSDRRPVDRADLLTKGCGGLGFHLRSSGLRDSR